MLQKLDLSGNRIGDEGAQAIPNALHHNSDGRKPALSVLLVISRVDLPDLAINKIQRCLLPAIIVAAFKPPRPPCVWSTTTPCT